MTALFCEMRVQASQSLEISGYSDSIYLDRQNIFPTSTANRDRFYNTTVQLSAGVRLVTGQVHKNNNEWHLCHSSCDLLDAGTLESWLSEIKTWLDGNPNDGKNTECL